MKHYEIEVRIKERFVDGRWVQVSPKWFPMEGHFTAASLTGILNNGLYKEFKVKTVEK